MEEETVTYERTDGVDAGHGHKFEWEMTTLAYLRCQRLHEQWKKDNRNGIKSFSVANNVKGAGKFDDIVIRVEYVVDSIEKNKVIFVQCKHIEDPCKNSEKKFKTLLAETKPLLDFFKSFVNIEQCKKQVLNESTNNEPTNNKQKLDQQDHNNLQSFFKSKNLKTEFVFFSNITIAPDFHLGIYKVCTEVSSKEDITNILFNSSNTSPSEMRLKKTAVPQSSCESVMTEPNSIRTHFHEKFRVLVNQPEPGTLIYEELHTITNTFEATDHLQAIITEIRSHFTSKNPCTALTEKSDKVSTVGDFILIRTKSIAIMKDFCNNFGTQTIFSKEITSEFQKQLENNKIITIKTNLQQLESIKVKQVFNSLPIEYMRLFLHSETDTDEWISARETRSYNNLKTIYVCSQTTVNFDKITINHNERIVHISGCNEQQIVLAEYLQQFSEETRNFILDAKLLSQGVKLDINSFCGNSWKYFLDENTICDILQNKLIELYEPLPDLNFYIDRHFQSETFDPEKMKRKMLEWKFVHNGVILFSESGKRVPGCEATYKIFENMHDVRTFVHNFRSELQDTYHLCSYCDNEPKLIYSFGKLSALTVKNTMAQGSLVHDKHTKIKIISDVAGMGKSTTLLALAELDKRNNPAYLIYFIELSKYLNELKDENHLSSTNAAINFVGKNILKLKEVALRVFINACNESGKVALYLDAFDEISPDAEKAFPLLLLTLEKTKICRIYVSSRPNYVHVLEKTLLQKSMQFLGLENDEKECALKGFWMQLLKKDKQKIPVGVLNDTAKKIVHLLHKEGHFFNDILAIPLQIRMLATIYYESLQKGHILELSTVNLSDLYENYIRLHAMRFYVEKNKMPWNDMKNEMKCRFIENAVKGAEEVACHSVIPELLEYNEAKMCNVLSSLCDDLGLITNKNPPVFLHRTIAEYLAAKYVVTKLNDFDEEEILRSILIDERFNIVRRFINSLLVSNSAESYCKKEKYQFGRNKKGNNPLHVASIEGNIEIMSFLLWCDKTLLNEETVLGQTAIHIACKFSIPEAVKLLLTYSDCSVNTSDVSGDTPLHGATIGSNTEIIEMILQRDKSLLNKQNKSGRAPINHACINSNEAAAKFFLKNPDCSVNLCDNDGDSVLHSAVRRGSLEIIEMILRRDKSLLNKQNKQGKSPLHDACIINDEATLKFLLENPDCLVNLCDEDGDTVLHSAASRCSPEVIEMILRRDKSMLNKKNELGETPLHCACEHENETAVKFLLENPECLVNLCDNDEDTVLHSAARHCSPEVMEMILRRDESVLNKQNIRGVAPLHRACIKENEAKVKLLLKNPDCLVNLCDGNGNTALHSAARRCSPEVIEMILRRDKSLLNKQNKLEEAPLHYACEYKNEAAVKFFLENSDCLVNLSDKDGNTVLHIAAGGCSPEVIEMILRRDKSLLNKQNDFGRAPVYFACTYKNEAASKFLLENPDCLVNLCDKYGDTVLHSAASRCSPKVIEMILRRDKSLLNKQNERGEAPLHCACEHDNETMKFVLKNPDCFVNMCEFGGDTFKLLKIIPQNEIVLINQQYRMRKTILRLAASKYFMRSLNKNHKIQRLKPKPNLEIVKLLIAYPDCSINMRAYNGLTALDIALKDKQQEIIEILLEHGAENGNRTVEEDDTHSAQSVTTDDDSTFESDDDSNSKSSYDGFLESDDDSYFESDDDSNSESDDDGNSESDDDDI